MNSKTFSVVVTDTYMNKKCIIFTLIIMLIEPVHLFPTGHITPGRVLSVFTAITANVLNQSRSYRSLELYNCSPIVYKMA